MRRYPMKRTSHIEHRYFGDLVRFLVRQFEVLSMNCLLIRFVSKAPVYDYVGKCGDIGLSNTF